MEMRAVLGHGQSTIVEPSLGSQVHVELHLVNAQRCFICAYSSHWKMNYLLPNLRPRPLLWRDPNKPCRKLYKFDQFV